MRSGRQFRRRRCWDTTLCYGHSNPDRLSLSETVSDGQFDWGGRLLKGNGGAQRFPSEWLEIIRRV